MRHSAFIICITFTLYLNSIKNGFVWDDRAAIVSNKDIQLKSTLYDFLHHDFWGQNITNHDSHKSYRPITTITYMIDYQIFGSSSWGYHLLNIVYFILVNISYMKLISLWLAPEGVIIATLLFICHPIHVESVAGLVGRADTLSALFYITGLSSYISICRSSSDSSQTNRSIHTTLAFLLSQFLAFLSSFSKETGATIYGLYIILEVIESLDRFITKKALLIKKSKSFIYMLKKYIGNISMWSYIRCVLVCIQAIMVALIRLHINGPTRLYEWTVLENHIHLLPLWKDRMLSYAQTHFWYAWKLFYPRHLVFDYGYACIPTIHSYTDIRNVLPLSIYLTLIALFLYGIRMKPFSASILFALALCTVPMIPAINVLFPIGTLLAERLLFIPSAGWCMLLSRLLTVELASYWAWIGSLVYPWHMYLYNRRPLHTLLTTQEILYIRGKYAAIILLLTVITPLCLLGGIRIVIRNTEWYSEYTLFHSAMSVCPHSVKTLVNYALFQTNDNNVHTAMLANELSTALYRNHSVAWTNSALNYEKISLPTLPHTYIRQLYATKTAISITNKRHAKAYHEEARILQSWYQSPSFRSHYLASSSSSPYLPPNITNTTTTTSVTESNMTMTSLLRVMAIQQAESAIIHGSVSLQLLHLLGSLYLENQQPELAEHYLLHAIKLAPKMREIQTDTGIDLALHKEENLKYANTYNELGNVYAMQGQYEKAADILKEGIQHDPTLIALYINLGNVYHKLPYQLHQAKEWLHRGITLSEVKGDMVNPALYNNLGSVELDIGEIESAEKWFQKAYSMIQGSDTELSHIVIENLQLIERRKKERRS